MRSGRTEPEDATDTTKDATAPAVPRMPLASGVRVGRFVIVELVAEGGMGALYKAYDPQLDRSVALKLVGVHGPGSNHFRERLLREARALARLSHPNVVAVYESGVFEDEVFVAN